MKKRCNILVAVLVFCLSVSLLPIEALAVEETKQVETEVEEKDISEPKASNQEVQEEKLEVSEPETEKGKPEVSDTDTEEEKAKVSEPESSEIKVEKSKVSQNPKASGQEKATEQSEKEEAKTTADTEESFAPGEDDPGAGRLSGNALPEFYGPMPRSRGAVTYKHNSRFNSGYTIQKGIDVSYYNGKIDWNKAKRDGVQFAIIRVAYRGYGKTGTLNLDPKAFEYLKGATAAGIPVGVYIFSQAITEKEAIQEADYIINAVKGYKISLPVVMDYEYASDSKGLCGRLYDAKLSRTKATNVCLAFMERVKERGYTPMLYGNPDMFGRQIYADQISSKYQIWLAHYTAQTSYAGAYNYWQYSSTGRVDGIPSNVDMNFRYIKNTTPTVTGVKVAGRTTNSIGLKWSKVSGAAGYDIYRKNSAGKYVRIGTTTGTSYTDKSLSPGKSYTYKVRFYKNEASGKTYGAYSGAVSGITAINGTKITKKSSSFSKARVTWKKLSGVSGYRVYRYNPTKKAYSRIKTLGSSSTNYLDEDLNASTTYKYKVRAYKKVGSTTIYSPYSQVVSVKTKGSVKGTVKASNVNVRKGAGTSYKALRKVGKNTRLTISGTKGNWYRTSVTVKGKKKTGYILKKYVRLSSSGSSSASKVGKPSIKLKAAAFNKIKLTWKKVSGASGYQIQRYSSSKKAYTTVKTITKGSTVSYTNGSLNASTTYKYRVRAYKKSGSKKVYGSWSTSKSAKTKGSRKAKIKASSVNVRTGAGTSYKSLKRLSKGTKLKVIGSKGSWYKVSLKIKGKTRKGYVLNKYIKFY